MTNSPSAPLSPSRSSGTVPTIQLRGSERLRFIDGLRGAASLAVACYHITRYGPIALEARRVTPEFLQELFDRGWVGVQVFFVISGFIIAYSVRSASVTPGYAGNYALRRSLRLDPPYWTTIAGVLLLHWGLLYLLPNWTSPIDVPRPLRPDLSPWLIGSHLLYIHKLQGFDSLSAGFWTLCIEVQFYLLYVTTLGVAQALGSFWTPSVLRDGRPAAWTPTGCWLAVLLGAFAVGSLFWFNFNQHLAETLAYHFYLFFPGCLAWWVLSRQVPGMLFWAYFAMALGRLSWQWALGHNSHTFELQAGLLASLAIYLLGRRGRLTTTLDWPWLQFLGRISYSLYLVHFPVAHLVCEIAWQGSGGTVSPPIAAGVLLLSLAASIAVADVLYRFVEAPSVRWAARLRPKGGD